MAKLIDDAYAQLANRRAQEEAIAAGAIKGKVLGTRAISPNGNEMQEIAARFIENSVNSLEDPAYDCIMWQINWDDTTGLFAAEEHKGSALHYLKSIGEDVRANELKQVMQILQSLFDVRQKFAPRNYYLKSVEGIGALNDNYKKRGVPSELTLQCYDDITWKLRTVAMMLNYVYYDRDRQLEVLPKNLRRFTCEFFISDVRDLRHPVQAYELDASPAASLKDKINNALQRAGSSVSNWFDKLMFGENEQVVNPTTGEQQFSLYTDNTFYKSDANAKLTKQHVMLTCSYATLNASPFPDSISNIEQSELGASLKLQVYDYDFALFNTALDAIIDALLQKTYNEELEKMVVIDGQTMKMVDAIEQGKVGKAMALGVWDSIKKKVTSGVKAAAGQFCNSMIQYTKNKATSVFTNTVANASDSLGINDIVQDIKQYTNPAFLQANIDRLIDPFIDKVTGNVDYRAIVKSGYFTDERKAREERVVGQTYHKKLE